jgi:hypothetical protein
MIYGPVHNKGLPVACTVVLMHDDDDDTQVYYLKIPEIKKHIDVEVHGKYWRRNKICMNDLRIEEDQNCKYCTTGASQHSD